MQPSRQPGAPRGPVILPASEQFALRCPEGGEYRIFVAWPPGDPPPGGFPVIYQLDANAAFGTMVEAMRLQSRHPEVTGVEPCLVVGIGYPTEEPFDVTRRTHDYTPAAPAESIGERPGGEPWPSTGGASAFRAFLTDRLMPEIARIHPVDRGRQALFGHSFGGLFVLDTLLTAAGWFHCYVASSPSLWWARRILFERLGDTADIPPARVRVSVGSREQGGTPRPGGEAHARWALQNRMIDNARDFAAQLAARPGLDIGFRLFDDEDHGSVVVPAISHALRGAFTPLEAYP